MIAAEQPVEGDVEAPGQGHQRLEGEPSTASGLVRHAVIGKAAEVITAEAAKAGADLIILGPSRRGELATRLLGSVTQHVLQHAPCPVLVASPASKADPDRVAAAEHAAAVR
ncbi:MAG: universal stress protein [Solirubrobacteraceae bacterium]